MQPVFIIVGPPGVGKSTTSRALAARFPKSIHIPVDDLRHMVAAGLALPGPRWSDELVAQVTLARETAAQMALSYRHAGFAVIVDDFVDPYGLVEYDTLRGHPGVQACLLYPSQREAHRRNYERSGDSPARAYIDEGIWTVYTQLRAAAEQLTRAGWHMLDTTRLSVEETVDHLLQTAHPALTE